MSKADLQTTCESFITNGSQLINPCGLIANSLFTGNPFFETFFVHSLPFFYQRINNTLFVISDVFTLDTAASSPSTVSLDSSDIAWESDKEKFKQPKGFQSKVRDALVVCCIFSVYDVSKRCDSTG